MSEEKRKELEEMEAAEGVFTEAQSREGLLNDEEAEKTVGGLLPSTTTAICQWRMPKPGNHPTR